MSDTAPGPGTTSSRVRLPIDEVIDRVPPRASAGWAMSAEPLSREERDDAQRFWHVREYGFHYDTARRYEATVERLESLLETFTDDETCWLDHHGYCQSHGWFDEDECNMARARRLLGLANPGARGDQ